MCYNVSTVKQEESKMIYIFSTETFELVKVDCTMDELENRAGELLEKDMTVDDEFSVFKLSQRQ
jgi:hypothetical protein